MMTNEELMAGVEEPTTEEVTEEATTTEEVVEASGSETDTSTDATTDTDTDTVSDDSGDTTDKTEDTATAEMFKIKVDGEEVEVSLDELKKGYGTQKSAMKKFDDAAIARQQAEKFIHMLQTDPMAVLSDPSIGLDARKVAEEYLAKQIKFDQMTPEQQELVRARNTLAQHDQEKQKREQDEYQAKQDQLTEKYTADFTKQISEALTTDGLPVTQQTQQRMVGYMLERLNSKDETVQNLTDADLVGLVREDYVKDIQNLFGKSDAEAMINLLGSDVSNKIRAFDLSKLKNPGKPQRSNNPVKAEHGKAEKEEKMNTADWDAYMDSFS